MKMNPEQAKKLQQRALALIDFGITVLRILTEDRDWNADTLQLIAHKAYVLRLAKDNDEGFFETIQPE